MAMETGTLGVTTGTLGTLPMTYLDFINYQNQQRALYNANVGLLRTQEDMNSAAQQALGFINSGLGLAGSILSDGAHQKAMKDKFLKNANRLNALTISLVLRSLGPGAGGYEAGHAPEELNLLAKYAPLIVGTIAQGINTYQNYQTAKDNAASALLNYNNIMNPALAAPTDNSNGRLPEVELTIMSIRNPSLNANIGNVGLTGELLQTLELRMMGQAPTLSTQLPYVPTFATSTAAGNTAVPQLTVPNLSLNQGVTTNGFGEQLKPPFSLKFGGRLLLIKKQ